MEGWLGITVRGYEGTTARAWPAGSKVICAVTSTSFDQAIEWAKYDITRQIDTTLLAAYDSGDLPIDHMMIGGIYYIIPKLLDDLPPNTPNGGQLIVTGLMHDYIAPRGSGVIQTLITDYINREMKPSLCRREYVYNGSSWEWTPWDIYPLVPLAPRVIGPAEI